MSWQTFGFENIKNYFEKALGRSPMGEAVADNTLEHAYLFSGQEMIGKKTFAVELASQLHTDLPDLFMLGDESIGIDEIRKLKNFLSFKPYSSPYKIVIINDAHQMGAEAANAMLKVLEEPPTHSLIILISSNPRALLPTIYSRCVEIKFAPHPKDKLLKYLEKLGLNGVQAEFLADFSNGRLGLAHLLKEKNAFKDIKKNLEEFNKILKLNLNDRLKLAESLVKEDSNQASELLLYWMFYLRSNFSNKLKINRAKVLKSLLETRQILSHSQFNHRLALENLFINL